MLQQYKLLRYNYNNVCYNDMLHQCMVQYVRTIYVLTKSRNNVCYDDVITIVYYNNVNCDDMIITMLVTMIYYHRTIHQCMIQ